MDIYETKHVKSYYEDLGRQSDYLLRCTECKSLVTHADVTKSGACRCGNRRLAEIRSLSPWEWLKIRLGLINFPYRREFLREFNRG